MAYTHRIPLLGWQQRARSRELAAAVKQTAAGRQGPALPRHKALRRRVLASAEGEATQKDAALPSSAAAGPDKAAAAGPESEGEVGADAAAQSAFAATTMLQLWALLLGLGYAGVPLLAQLLSGLHGGGSGGGEGAAAGLDQAAALFGVELVVLLGVRGLLQRKLAAPEAAQLPRLSYRWDVRSIAVGLGAGGAALAVNSGLQALLGQAGEQPGATGDVGEILQSHDPLAAALLFLGAAVLAPAAEEMAYRGFLLPALQRVLPTAAAVGASALLFATAHLQAEGLVQLSVVGACLGTAMVVSGGNLAAPTAGHILYNASLFIGLLVASL